MVWPGRTDLMKIIIQVIKQEYPNADLRKQMYKPIYEQLLNMDWDTQDECIGLDPAFDEVMKEEAEEYDAKHQISGD